MSEPSWEEYLKRVEQRQRKLTNSPDQETELRMLAWRRYNDIYRGKLYSTNNSWENLLLKKAKKERSIEVPRIPSMMDNCNTVATWLYEGNPHKAMDKADILRWLGRYELALQLLEKVAGLNEYEEQRYGERYEILFNLSKGRDSSLAVVSI